MDDLTPGTRAAIDRPGQQSADRRDKILDVAERLFAEQGFAATSMRDLAQLAGVNVATVYYHCGSKEQLFLQIYGRLIERMATFAGDTLASGGSFEAGVGRVVDRVVEVFATSPSIPRMLLRADLGELPGTEGPRRETFQPLLDLAVTELRGRAKRGEIRAVDPRAFLRAATGVILHLSLSVSEEGRSLEVAQEHARAFVLGALGLLSPPPSGRKGRKRASKPGHKGRKG